MMNHRKAQLTAVMGLIGIFLFAIVATTLLPTLGDEIDRAEKDWIGVLNDNETVNNNTITYIFPDNIGDGIRSISITNNSGGAVPERTLAPGWQLISGTTGNISVNYTGQNLGAATIDVQVDYEYYSYGNLSSMDRSILELWPTFIIIAGLLAILAAVGLR